MRCVTRDLLTFPMGTRSQIQYRKPQTENEIYQVEMVATILWWGRVGYGVSKVLHFSEKSLGIVNSAIFLQSCAEPTTR